MSEFRVELDHVATAVLCYDHVTMLLSLQSAATNLLEILLKEGHRFVDSSSLPMHNIAIPYHFECCFALAGPFGVTLMVTRAILMMIF